MADQYGLSDLRQYIDGRSFFPAISQPPDLLSCHRGLSSPNPYDMLMIRSDSAAAAASRISAAAVSFGAEPALGGDGGSGRWPRQETLTLLEIRSRLDPRFKEANQKGPLWDEVARIMSEENGYQRSGKKCREKFENLYKYYKKTKEGKSGRQDGKHYRFFRQLEALYGETSNSASATHFNGGSFPNSLVSDQEGAPASCDYDTTSSYCSDSNVRVMDSGNGDSREKKRRDRRRLKANIEESIDAQMKNMMEKQEEWMKKMTTVIESKERERLMREEQWRKQDAVRIEREKEIWASKRAWVEARDAALAEAINQLGGKELQPPAAEEDEIARLIQLRSGMESKFQENGISEEAMWDQIAARMGCSGLMCREKWDQIINDYLIKCSKKRRENWNHDDEGVAGVEGATLRLNGHGNSPMNDGFFRYFIGESYQRL